MALPQAEHVRRRLYSADRAVYTASTELGNGVVVITAEDVEYPVDTFRLGPGSSLRNALKARGWRIIGAGRVWGSIRVERW